MSSILLMNPSETLSFEIINIVVNFFYAFAEILMLSFLLIIAKKTY